MIEFDFACDALFESAFYTCCKRLRLRADEDMANFKYLSLASDSEVGVLAGFEDPEMLANMSPTLYSTHEAVNGVRLLPWPSGDAKEDISLTCYWYPVGE
jgi:hypothetical protein